ncbi:hypothetical protein HG66A1_54760 [Gimesia chilikensis]|uniref:Uncharacterized protein n=1 Tax=Gimesia chilikensis TaxID=2605989 RepID=A0A517PWA3_9PLAN|nr:hypothetical protein HG66A1_54760 [Gimesia chilikensis]
MNSPNEDDWRITGQEKYLDGAVLELREYFPPSAEWEHDHCEFCWSKFCRSNEAECLHEGYVTEDGKHWICSNCFKDFQDRFHFSLKQI